LILLIAAIIAFPRQRHGVHVVVQHRDAALIVFTSLDHPATPSACPRSG
jgi:hypothetical protein